MAGPYAAPLSLCTSSPAQKNAPNALHESHCSLQCGVDVRVAGTTNPIIGRPSIIQPCHKHSKTLANSRIVHHGQQRQWMRDENRSCKQTCGWSEGVQVPRLQAVAAASVDRGWAPTESVGLVQTHPLTQPTKQSAKGKGGGSKRRRGVCMRVWMRALCV